MYLFKVESSAHESCNDPLTLVFTYSHLHSISIEKVGQKYCFQFPRLEFYKIDSYLRFRIELEFNRLTLKTLLLLELLKKLVFDLQIRKSLLFITL